MTSANNWKAFLLRSVTLSAMIFAAVSAALVSFGRADPPVRRYVTIAGVVSGGGIMAGTTPMRFSFHDVGGTTSCNRDVMADVAPDGTFSVEVPMGAGTGPCPEILFDGHDVQVDVSVNGETVMTNRFVNPVPYAIHAEQAAFATAAASATPDSGLSQQLATAATAVPAGTIIAFGGSTVPPGWLLCDGSAVDRTGTYAALFTAIGTAWGAGDGMRTFNVPDLRGRFLRGVDGDAGVDPDRATRTASRDGGRTGDQVGSVQAGATAMPNTVFAAASAGLHTHEITTPGGWAAGPINGGRWRTDLNSPANPWTPPTALPAGAHTHAITGGDSETRPVNAAVNYIIRY